MKTIKVVYKVALREFDSPEFVAGDMAKKVKECILKEYRAQSLLASGRGIPGVS